MKKDPRVDAYIAKSQEFARPVLTHLRSLVHKACPEVEETIKWGFPHFDYKGIMASMAAFKAHCVFGFWKGSLMKDPDRVMVEVGNTAMGSFGRITKPEDLPADEILLKYIGEAVKLNEDGIRIPAAPKKAAKDQPVPEYFKKELKKNPEASKTFEGLSTSHRNEYVEWITEAKREETRSKRVEQAIGMLCEGKSRNWKYERKPR